MISTRIDICLNLSDTLDLVSSFLYYTKWLFWHLALQKGESSYTHLRRIVSLALIFACQVFGVKMQKKVANSSVARELKKEYLREHLDDVRGFIGKWIPQLIAPLPFAWHESRWGWQSVYKPPLEQDSASNHMLRRHAKSRALWKHHTNWEETLEDIWCLASEIWERAEDMHLGQLGNAERHYAAEYMGVALWKGFDLACGQILDNWYKTPIDGRGLAYGAYIIDVSAVSTQERSSTEDKHRALISDLAGFEEMKELAALWHKVIKLQEQMHGIAGRILKSNDILYPCRFCRHLWK